MRQEWWSCHGTFENCHRPGLPGAGFADRREQRRGRNRDLVSYLNQHHENGSQPMPNLATRTGVSG